MNSSPSSKWRDLDSVNRDERQEAVNRIRDQLEFGIFEAEDAPYVGQRLLITLRCETDADIRGDILDALHSLTVNHGPLPGSWDILASQLDSMPTHELEFAIAILGLTGKLRFVETVKSFLSHKADFIREAAREALEQLLH